MDASNLPTEIGAGKAPSTVRKRVDVEKLLLPNSGEDSSLEGLRQSLNQGVELTLSRRLRLFVKRSIDIVVSASALIMFSPAFLFLILIIRAESPGPAIFRQIRWGRNNTLINIYKFRTMHEHLGDDSGKAQTTQDDPRKTPLGTFLRRYNIDELPQLINVLMGDMSLIGPRCHVMDMLADGKLYEDAVPGYKLRHILRPGITGLAQCNGFRGPTTDLELSQERARLDLLYVRDFSIMLDFKIAWKTFVYEFKGGNGF